MALTPRTQLLRTTIVASAINVVAYTAFAAARAGSYQLVDWVVTVAAFGGFLAAAGFGVLRAGRLPTDAGADQVAGAQRRTGITLLAASAVCLVALAAPAVRAVLGATGL